jgi:hypothetical protein
LRPIGVNVTVSWLWGGSPRPVFFFFFRGEAAKKEEKRIFLGDAIPQTPALQSGKPLKLTHMGLRPLAFQYLYKYAVIATRAVGIASTRTIGGVVFCCCVAATKHHTARE